MLESLQHVSEKADTLQSTTTKPKDDVCKAPLLTKISQSSLRGGPTEVNSPSSSRKQQAASGGSTRGAGPTTDEWVDPGTNKKRGTRVLMRFQLLMQRLQVLHRYGAHGPKQQK